MPRGEVIRVRPVGSEALSIRMGILLGQSRSALCEEFAMKDCTMTFLAIFLLMISYPGITSHVEGWPQDLEVHEHVVSASIIADSCGIFAIACAKANLYTGRCDVYLPSWAPDWIREHEIEHCRGGDHMAPEQLSMGPSQAYFEAWVAAQKPRISDPLAAASCLASSRNSLIERLPVNYQLAAREALAGRGFADIARATGMSIERSESTIRELCQIFQQSENADGI
jgi:hypothetical protein